MAKLWPVILSLVMVAAYFFKNDERLTRTAKMAERTAEEVSILKQTVAVQTQMLSDIRDAVRDIQQRGR